MLVVTTNKSQERTGNNGELPENQKDIKCPNITDGGYRLNYFSASCDERLVNKSCKNTDCERFRGSAPTCKEYRRAIGGVNGEGRPLIVCASCERV